MTRLVAVLGVAAALAACDPVHDDTVESLGPETAGVGEGPLHRPGQPCLACHGGSGPGSPAFGVAGTVFQRRSDRAPLGGAVVEVIDAAGELRRFGTNEAGNFYVPASEWSPVHPLRVKVSQGGTTIEMKTRVGGDGSCGGCHRDPASQSSVGHIFLVDDLATDAGTP